jgi:hypothetical protein
MTIETETHETTKPIRHPANPDHETDVRLSPEQIAMLRSHVPRRYLARVHVFGECVMPEERRPLEIAAPLIVRTTPAVGPELAATAVGIPINLARRPRDGVLTHWMPDGPTRQLHGIHPEIHVGYVGRAWPDRFGVMAELLVFREDIIPDLDIAELTGELWSCGLCLSFTTLEQAMSRVRFTGHHVADIRRARSYALDFAGLPLLRGCRLLRQVDRDEAVLEEEGPPPDHRYVLTNEQATAAPAPDGAVVPGTVGTPELDTDAVTEKISAPGSSAINTTSSTTADIADMSLSVTTVAGDLVIVTLRMREVKIENTSASAQNVTAFLEITDGSNAIINGDADDHWTFPLSAAGGGAAFVVVPVNIVTFDTPAAGSHTYKGRWRVSGSVDSSVKVTNANSRRLQAIRQKR